jgi:hypothetical protein
MHSLTVADVMRQPRTPENSKDTLMTFPIHSWHNPPLSNENGDKMRVDETQLLGIVISSIPAKPLAQAKLNVAGFLLP